MWFCEGCEKSISIDSKLLLLFLQLILKNFNFRIKNVFLDKKYVFGEPKINQLENLVGKLLQTVYNIFIGSNINMSTKQNLSEKKIDKK